MCARGQGHACRGVPAGCTCRGGCAQPHRPVTWALPARMPLCDRQLPPLPPAPWGPGASRSLLQNNFISSMGNSSPGVGHLFTTYAGLTPPGCSRLRRPVPSRPPALSLPASSSASFGAAAPEKSFPCLCCQEPPDKGALSSLLPLGSLGDRAGGLCGTEGRQRKSEAHRDGSRLLPPTAPSSLSKRIFQVVLKDRGPLGPQAAAQRLPGHGKHAGEPSCSHLTLKGASLLPPVLCPHFLFPTAGGRRFEPRTPIWSSGRSHPSALQLLSHRPHLYDFLTTDTLSCCPPHQGVFDPAWALGQKVIQRKYSQGEEKIALLTGQSQTLSHARATGLLPGARRELLGGGGRVGAREGGSRGVVMARTPQPSWGAEPRFIPAEALSGHPASRGWPPCGVGCLGGPSEEGLLRSLLFPTAHKSVWGRGTVPTQATN